MSEPRGHLLAREITVRFGGLVAVSEASIDVPAGGFVGLIGPNGAGKTTLFNTISGFLAPGAGRVFLDDRDITDAPPAARAKLGIGRTFQKLELFSRMSVFDNLMVAAESARSRLDIASDLLNLPRRRSEERRCAGRVEQVLELTDLSWARDRRASDLPIGTARIVELARALAADPALLLLDEPSSGLDSAETTRFGDLLLRINREAGIGILLVEHDMDLVMRVCQHITVLDFGRVIAIGTPPDIIADPTVRTAYLGEEDRGAAPATSRG